MKNEPALPAHVHSQNKVFHKLFCGFYLSFCAFLLRGLTTYLQRRQFEGVTPSNECIYHPRLYRLFCESTLCEVSRLACGPLLSSSHPPLSLSQHLTSIITALDSSNDGKCFSIPCSPSTPPESPSFPFSLQANYISVTIETCSLNAFCFTLSLTHSSAFPPPCLLSSRMRLN